MKIKFLILSAILALVLAFGFACGESQESGSSEQTSSSTESTDIVEDNPIISLNQNSVKICIGDEFTFTATAKNIENAEFTWAVDGDSPTDVISFTQSGNSALVKAEKLGVAKLVATLTLGETVYYESAVIEVVEIDNVTILLNNFEFDKDGYCIKLSTLAENGHIGQFTPSVSVYVNDKYVSSVTPTWTCADSDVLTITNNVFKAEKAGNTVATATCTVGGKEYSVKVNVEVYRPQISLSDSFTVEVENLQSGYEINSTVKTVSPDVEVTYMGKAVGSYDSQAKKITFEKSALPSSAKYMGDNREFLIETDLASYAFSVNLYTKIILNKNDFNGMATLAKKACPQSKALWDGYFVLGADIEYNDHYVAPLADIGTLWSAVEGSWYNGVLYGFKGVFDGKGHKVVGVSIENGREVGGVFGVLHVEGVIKNVAFTKASVAANASLVCSTGAGTIENVYISYESIGKGVQRIEGDGSISNHCASFFGYKEPTLTANVTNCVIDVSSATIDKATSIKLAGSEHVTYKNVFVIGGSYELRAKSNATMAFESITHFIEDVNAQGRYKKFDGSFWSLTSGVPVAKSVLAEVENVAVSFDEEIANLVVGTAYKFKLSTKYAIVSSDSDCVEIKGGVVTVLTKPLDGEKVTFTATSLFDESKTQTIDCNMLDFDLTNCKDLTDRKEHAFYDITIGKVYFAELDSACYEELENKHLQDEILYYVNEDFTYATFPDDGEDMKSIVGVAKDSLYLFNCKSVTKVISIKEDLNYVRRDYTVTVENAKGMYDGVITGTFVMINDIDCTGLTLKNTGTFYENTRGFSGTFDGRGYTIKNLTAGANGLFGVLCNAKIQNVNFENVYLKASNEEGTDGSYVALFGASVYNSQITDVKMHFASYVEGNTLYHTSGLMFYEKSFDSTFTNIQIDIADIQETCKVKYLTELYYDQTLTGTSKYKSVYENVTVIVKNKDDKGALPVFAYNYKSVESSENPDGEVEAEPYPNGITFLEREDLEELA